MATSSEMEKNYYQLAIPTTGINRHDKLALSELMPVTTGSTTTNITSEKGMVLKDITGTVNVNVSHNSTIKQSGVVTLVTNGLKKAYSEMTASLTLPWLRSEPYDMEQCFSQLESLVKVIDSSGNDIEAPPSSTKLECIFDRAQSLKPTRIFLEGPEDILSSIVLLQLCRYWSSGYGPAVIFDLVLLLDGRNLLNNTLAEVIVQECSAKEVASDSLLKMIKEHPKVLLIFHQLPRDLHWGQKTAFNQILKGASYEAATVLLSYQVSGVFRNDLPTNKEYIICSSRESCTKVVCLHRLQFITEDLLDTSNQVQSFEKELQNFLSLDLEKPVFVLLLMHMYLRVKFPNEQMFRILRKTGFASHDLIQEKIYKCILKRLVMDHITPKYPVLFNKFDEKNIPPEALFLSRIGEYALNTLASGSSDFTLEEMESHFQNELASVLQIGFVLVQLHYSEIIYVKKLQLVHYSLLEYLIAYHVNVVYRTQSSDQFVLKVDLLYKFQPLNRDSSKFLCESLALFMFGNWERAFATLREDRAHYSTLINSIAKCQLHTRTVMRNTFL